MKLFDKFFKKEPTIKFKSHIGDFSICSPVVESWKIKSEWMKNQKPENKFTICPGMLDYHMTGYIICAHTDIAIKANKSGVVVVPQHSVGLTQFEKSLTKPSPFQYKLVEGMVPINDNVAKNVYKIPLPWSIFTKPGYSAYVLPPLMHSQLSDKIFVYPGVVDYDQFHDVSFVFSAIKECEIIIPTGTPLLQVIPFKREKITAECGKSTESERDKHYFSLASREIKNYYRRFLSERKSFKMKCPYEHPQYKDKK